MNTEYIPYKPMLIEIKIQMLTSHYSLQYERMQKVTLTNLMKYMQVACFLYDFTTKYYSLDVHFPTIL